MGNKKNSLRLRSRESLPDTFVMVPVDTSQLSAAQLSSPGIEKFDDWMDHSDASSKAGGADKPGGEGRMAMGEISPGGS